MNDYDTTLNTGLAVASPEDRNLAMLTHLSGILLSIIVPLIIWITNKERPEKSWLVGQAREALNFQIMVLIAYVACTILSFVLIGALLMPLVWIFNLVFCIIAGMAANKGDNYRYPVSIRIVK